MIKVTVELWKKGNPNDIEVLGSAEITNDGSGSKGRGNYNYVLRRRGNRTWKRGHIAGFNRQMLSVWVLLLWVLADAIGITLTRR